MTRKQLSYSAVAIIALAIVCFAQTKIIGNRTIEGTVNYAADAGSTDDYAITLSPAITSYITGACFTFKANTANTGAATLNVNSVGAKTIKKAVGGVTTDLATNDIRSGQLVDACYDGTNMQMQSAVGNTSSLSGNEVTAAGTLTADAPMIGAGSKAAAVGTRSGDTTEFGTISGTKTTSKQLAFDASGNIIASASAIGGGSGAPTPITNTYANIVATTCDSGANGTIAIPTDSFYDMLLCNGSSWQHYFMGKVLTPPSTSVLTTAVNSPTVVTTNGGMYIGGAAGTLQVRGQYQTAPATPYTVDVVYIPHWVGNASAKVVAGISYRASAADDQAIFGHTNINTCVVNQYTSLTVLGNQQRTGPPLHPYDKVVWARMTNDGTTRRFWESSNGVRYMETLGSHGHNAFITENQIGIAFASEDTSFEAGATFLHYKVY